MKTKIVRLGMSALVAAQALLIVGCNPGLAETRPVAGDPLAMQPAPPVPQLPPTNIAADFVKSGPTYGGAAGLEPIVPPPDFTPSTNLADVIKLLRAGVSDSLLESFITNTSGTFALGAAGIVYLHDLGLSDDLINAMLQRDNQPPLVAPSTVAEALPQPVTAPVAEESPPAPAPAVVAVEQPAPVTANYFYDTLSPYGGWIELDGYGRCWQPTIVLSRPGWRPYCDNGRWVYSNCGWYWASDYSWGVAFHYGRWFNYPGRGWCWMPDTVWGPAWVSWRASSDYCGWAPMPPRSTWVAGVGLTYHGSSVSVGFDFGLASSCYTFVPRKNFCDRRPHRYAMPHSQVNQVIHQTTVINNYARGNNNTIINHGVVAAPVRGNPPGQTAGGGPGRHAGPPRNGPGGYNPPSATPPGNSVATTPVNSARPRTPVSSPIHLDRPVRQSPVVRPQSPATSTQPVNVSAQNDRPSRHHGNPLPLPSAGTRNPPVPESSATVVAPVRRPPLHQANRSPEHASEPAAVIGRGPGSGFQSPQVTTPNPVIIPDSEVKPWPNEVGTARRAVPDREERSENIERGSTISGTRSAPSTQPFQASVQNGRPSRHHGNPPSLPSPAIRNTPVQASFATVAPPVRMPPQPVTAIVRAQPQTPTATQAQSQSAGQTVIAPARVAPDQMRQQQMVATAQADQFGKENNPGGTFRRRH